MRRNWMTSLGLAIVLGASGALPAISEGTTGKGKAADNPLFSEIGNRVGSVFGGNGLNGGMGNVPGLNMSMSPGSFGTVFAGCGSALAPSCRQDVPDSFAAETGCENQGTISLQSSQGKLVLSKLQCQSQSLSMLQEEMRCLSSAAQGLANTLGELQQSFVNNIQKFQREVTENNREIQDREKQIEDITQHLMGDKEIGKPGLKEIEAKTKALVGQMPQQIQGIKQKHVDLDTQRKSLEELVQTRRMALATQCFNSEKNSGFQCVKGGPAVSAAEYAVCRYQQNAQLGTGGQLEENQGVAKQAEGRGDQLKALLAQIFADAPKEANLPNVNPANLEESGKQIAAFENQGRSVLTPEQIQKKYLKDLQAFDVNDRGERIGIDISSFVIGYIKQCYQQKSAQVDQERQMASSSIGKLQDQIKRGERDTQTQFNQIIDQYSQQTNEIMGGLTGMNLPLNTQACLSPNQTPAGQERCLDDAYTNIKGLLEGSLPQSTVNVTIKGTKPENYFPIQCQGLSGCIKKLENQSKNLKSYTEYIKKEKEHKILAWNQSLEQYKQQVAKSLGTQSRLLDDRVQAINIALSRLGVSGLIERKNVKGEKFEADEKFDGLYKIPESALDLIGGAMVPPMLDVRENLFQSAQTSIAERVAKIGESQAEVSKQLAILSGVPSKCAKEAEKERKQEMRDNMMLAQLQKANGGGGGDTATGQSAGGLNPNCDEFRKLNSELSANIITDSDVNKSPTLKRILETGRRECHEKTAEVNNSMLDQVKDTAMSVLNGPSRSQSVKY